MAKTSDPTKGPEFQKVVQGFLTTKPEARIKNALVSRLGDTLAEINGGGSQARRFEIHFFRAT
jgi:hypothetical protein